MKSSHETGMNPESEPTRHQGPSLAGSEAAYERLSAYGFARRYVRGKSVVHIGPEEEGGYGSRLLAQSAESLTALTDLPKLPLPGGSFDVVVAFGVIEDLEHPEELVREAKRVLKEGGVLLVSVPEKRTVINDRGVSDGRTGMYVPEFRVLLERHFEHVRLYRQGAVAGGLVFPLSKELTASSAAMPVESIRLSSSGPRLGMESPTTRSVMAVCSEAAEVLGQEEGEEAYLLLDRDRRVFDECEERAEDVELMRGEIQRMQETEVQVFLKTLSAQKLPLGVLLRLLPQVLLYYSYNRQKDPREVGHSRGTVLEKARHRWDTTLAEVRHSWDTAFAEVRYRWDTTLAEVRHRRDVTLREAYKRRNLDLAEVRHRRNETLEQAHLRRDVALEEARLRRDGVLKGSRLRRYLALENTLHRRDLVLAEVRHRRNLTLERIIHRRNIIRGNVQALRQKDARGLARGALRRLSALYRRLRDEQRP